MKELVSVIVTTKNSIKTIEACLNSIKNQSYDNIEIIVVDNKSTDNTLSVAKKYARVYSKGPERSAQRNYGAKNSKGDYLLFIDSDMILTKFVVSSCVRKINQGFDSIIIPEKSFGTGYWAKMKKFERIMYLGSDDAEAARFFGKKDFVKFKGYDETITGLEDWDLPNRIRLAGLKIGRIKQFINHDEGDASPIRQIKKAYYYSKGSYNYIKKNSKQAFKHLNPFKNAFIKNYKEFLKKPYYSIPFFLLRILIYAAGAFGLMSEIFNLKKMKK